MTTPERQPSRTALLVAAYRARASRRTPQICNDPWAAAIAGAEGEALADRQDAIFPHLELWTAIRTAYIDGHVTRLTAGDDALRQVVMLGAGFDTRAARLARPGVRYFEVDQPASQAWKREKIGALTGYPVDAATHVSCDFEHQDFVDRLLAAGWRADAPSLIVWEGVTPYLPEPAIRATLARVASRCHERSVLVFDHLHRARSRAPEPKADTREFVSQLGEPVLFGSSDMLPILYQEGFRHVRSLSFDEACLTLTGTYLREREYRFQRMVVCSRTARELVV